jgi:glutamyl-Q tRNA(Asp) synthetase
LSQYIGRFAPSPTGPLHLGSLVAAMASYVDALAHNGRWLLRIEDVDAARCSSQSERIIRAQLEAYGFVSEGDVLRQSERTAKYDLALSRLIATGRVYACRCTRKTLESAPKNSDGETIYPGTCRSANIPLDEAHTALRVNVDSVPPITFVDRTFGEVTQTLADDIGDFVIRRSDGVYAYQLAVVVDDAEQGVTHVVRGADLLGNTARQILLQQLLGVAAPSYQHVPIVRNETGEKLSKQTRAEPISVDPSDVLTTLQAAWRHLCPDAPIDARNVNEFWRKATTL